ncbi:pyridoxine biosynthesis transcriptional regulator PdxR [Leucobacter tardus]
MVHDKIQSGVTQVNHARRTWQNAVVRRTGAGGPSEIPLHLDRSVETTLPVQLAAGLRDAIDRDTLRGGESVPPTRELARRVGVARGVVVAAYEQLIAEGYLSAGHGRGTVVNPDLGRSTAPKRPVDETAGRDTATTRLRPPLAPGAPLSDATMRPAWRAAWRDAASLPLGGSPPDGDARLRHEIAEHLRLMRGTARSADDVLVTAGAREGLGLVLTALGTTRGHGLVVGVEDPGYPSLRGVAARHGARIVPLPVDQDGLRTADLPIGLLDVVIVTPSHQYPAGGSLPLQRRRELLEWAGRTGVVIAEDDYDSELRYSGSPLPALAALDDPVSGSVVTLGTFSNTVSPALSAGFLLAPANLRALLAPIRADLGAPVSSVVQVALAAYLAAGELRRNITRVRRRTSARRDDLSETLAGIDGIRVRPMSGGLNAVLEFTGAPDAGAERRLVARAAAPSPRFPSGLGVAALGDYWQDHRGAAGAGLVLGTGGPDEEEFRAAIQQLRTLLDAESRSLDS